MPLSRARFSFLRRFFALLLVLAGASGWCCTIFVLTDGHRALFFNNEDWSNPAACLWFVPAGPDHLGCAYVGFDDGWAQGGVNTAGLAFDWVGSTRVSLHRRVQRRACAPALRVRPGRKNRGACLGVRGGRAPAAHTVLC